MINNFFLQKINIAAFESKINELLSKSYNYQKEFIKKVLQLEEGQQAILSNGRVRPHLLCIDCCNNLLAYWTFPGVR